MRSFRCHADDWKAAEREAAADGITIAKFVEIALIETTKRKAAKRKATG